MASSLKQSALSPLAQGVLKGGIFFVTLVLVACLLRFADASGLFDASFLNDYVKDQGAVGIVLFFGMSVVFSAIGLPRQLISVAAGYAFGVVMGTMLVGLALVGGGMISFYYMRFLARDAMRRRFTKKIAAIERVWLAKPFLLTVCLRLLPVGSNTLINMLAGTSKVHPLPFFCGSFVGYIPQNLIFALLGSGIGFDDTEKFLYSGLLFLVSVSLGVFVYRSLRKQGTDLLVAAPDGLAESVEPVKTAGPVEPGESVEPVEPGEPGEPVEPGEPGESVEPDTFVALGATGELAVAATRSGSRELSQTSEFGASKKSGGSDG